MSLVGKGLNFIMSLVGKGLNFIMSLVGRKGLNLSIAKERVKFHHVFSGEGKG